MKRDTRKPPVDPRPEDRRRAVDVSRRFAMTDPGLEDFGPDSEMPGAMGWEDPGLAQSRSELAMILGADAALGVVGRAGAVESHDCGCGEQPKRGGPRAKPKPKKKPCKDCGGEPRRPRNPSRPGSDAPPRPSTGGGGDLPSFLNPPLPIDDLINPYDPGDGVPLPTFEPYGYAPTCDIQAPPVPTGELNPGLGPPPANDFSFPPAAQPQNGFLLGTMPTPQSNLPAPVGGTVLGPDKPLCPPNYTFDYQWQSCWPNDNPPAHPPAFGQQYEHACKCPPEKSWLAREKRCWTRGQVAGSTHGGFADGFNQGDPSHFGMPYRTDVYNATDAEIDHALSDHPGWFDIEVVSRIGLHDDDWPWTDDIMKCHTQGITFMDYKFVTSCMTIAGHGVAWYDDTLVGYLQFYDYNGIHEVEDDFQDGFGSGSATLVRVDEQPWPHAVTGQAVRGIEVDNGSGLTSSKFVDHFLFPVGSEPSEGSPPEGLTTKIRIYDEQGSVVREFFMSVGYGCGALFHWQFDGSHDEDLARPTLYLLCIDTKKDHKSITLIRFIWSGWSLEFLDQEAVIQAADTEEEYGEVLKHDYSAINLFYSKDGTLHMVATHGRWMDTYKVTLTEVAGKWSIIFDKIAKIEYPDKVAEGLFHEGVAIQPLEGGKKMRFWCAPWDYRHFFCFPTDSEARCTYIWYFERAF